MLPYLYRVFSSHLFWRQQQKSPSIPGETCTTRCSVSRGLHLFSVFSVQLEPTGVAQEEVYTGDFFFFFFSFCPTASCGACLHFCAIRVRPFTSLVNIEDEFCLLTEPFQLYIAFHEGMGLAGVWDRQQHMDRGSQEGGWDAVVPRGDKKGS